MLSKVPQQASRSRIGVGVSGLVLGLWVFWGCGGAWAGSLELKVDDRGEAVVTVDGQPFTQLRHQGLAKPVLYPIVGPGGAAMTRNWPLTEKPAEGEQSDHPHHKSFWYAHGDVNGVDFWSEKARIEQEEVLQVEPAGSSVSIRTRNKWIDPAGKIAMRDERLLRFSADKADRLIDLEITLMAPADAPVKLGDTKEGTMAIRTHPALRLKGSVATGKALNSNGQRDAAIWGKRAKWVDYWGQVSGKTAGVAIFDHPSNPRHPTHWHARDYGLIAANPFGIHDFEKKEKGAGNMEIAAGKSVTFRYRFVFHAGDAESAKVADRWEAFAAGK